MDYQHSQIMDYANKLSVQKKDTDIHESNEIIWHESNIIKAKSPIISSDQILQNNEV